MAVFHADALVIRSREYGESDRLLTLFSREKGKLQSIAKGVRKPKSRQRAGSQLFSYSEFLLHHGRNLNTINQASSKESFPHLWNDLDRTLAATAIAELLDIATIVEQSNLELFTLTLASFFLLEHTEPTLVQSAYTLRLLNILGYRPKMGQCPLCGSLIKGDRIYFSPEAGGTVCGQCRSSERGRWLSAGSIAFIRQLTDVDLSKLDRLRWNSRMQTEIIEGLQLYCEGTFDRSLRSWSMGSKLIGEGAGLQTVQRKAGHDDERSVVDGAGEN
ncbi:MAG: DNA repair protein RecO [Desulfitobacterium hafniense]|nr:DNA repair protein RecO [Desulfitobacterium hafniense]